MRKLNSPLSSLRLLIAIAFNAKYLADALNAIDAEGVALEMTEPLRPGVIRPVGGNRPAYLCVLMPMQVI